MNLSILSGSAHRTTALLIAVAGLLCLTDAFAQVAPAPHMSATRYDDAGRVVGTILPDPDGVGAGNPFLATRTTYDVHGNATKIETGTLSSWQSEAVAPADWGSAAADSDAFTAHSTVINVFDVANRKISEKLLGSDGSAVSMTQTSYDILGRPVCTAVRMNPATYSNLPADACALGAEGTQGKDRVTRKVYNDQGYVAQVRRAVGTPIEQAEVTYSYTADGKVVYVIDANGNRARLGYDPLGRQNRWEFPAITHPASFNDSTPSTALATAGPVNGSDYETYGYDANGNRTELRKRDGLIQSFTYDSLDRMTRKELPARGDLSATHTRDVYYGYDLRGLQTYARFDSSSGEGLITGYDGMGRRLSETLSMNGVSRTIGSAYDANGNRTQVVHPDGATFGYTFDAANRPVYGNVTGHYTAFGYLYNERGERFHEWKGNASSNQIAFDNAGRLNGVAVNLAGDPNDNFVFLQRNQAGQISSRTSTNDSYSHPAVNADTSYTTNGLNQYTAAGSASLCYDPNGNLTADAQYEYLYDIENRLVEMRARAGTGCSLNYSGQMKAALRYDPLGRLYEVENYIGGVAQGPTRFAYDGDALIAEYAGGSMVRRYVHGTDAGADDPVMQFDGPYVLDGYQNYLYHDERGSIVAKADKDGNKLAINTYDEYGVPGGANSGRFQYTGQAWLPELGMYYYKARMYSPRLGRFMQTDPIGYEDQFNLYAYVANDPVNKVDPTGTQDQSAFYIAMEKDAREEGKTLPEFIAEADQRAHLPEIGTLLLPIERAAAIIGKVAARTLGFERTVLALGSKQAAREALGGQLGNAANRFFRDAAKNSRDFKISDIKGGGKKFEFFSPARNEGYGKHYIQEVDKSGAVVREYKDTVGPKGLIERKWLHGEPN